MDGRWVIILVMCFVVGGCAGEEDPEVFYRYGVSGDNGGAEITYLDPELGLITVETSLPWQSEEFQGTPNSTAEIRAEMLGESGIECAIDWRSEDQSRRGSRTETTDPGEERPCSIVLESIGDA